VTTFPVAGGPDGAAVVQVAKDVTEEIASARRMRKMGEDLAAANRRSMAALVQLKAAQAQLVQAEKLSAIGHLVAGVAHELNNPLTSILGYAQLLEEELDAPHGPLDGRALAPDARRIAEESERAARIVRNLLAFARRQATVRAPLDVVELFERTVASREQALRSAGITVERAFDQHLPPIVADATQLQQALMNLLLNAEHAMRHREVRRLRVGARFDQAAASVELIVTDSGHGIEQANLTRIFDPFFTTREVGEGAGLGLSICYGIVRHHGGQILVDTTNAGTTFSLLLPASIDEAPLRDVLVAHAEGESSVIGAALEGWGYRVVSVTSSSAALERYSRGVHAVFLDTGLLGGDEAAWRAARARDVAHSPVVLMGVCEDAAVDRFRREHAAAVLVPPFQLRPLRAAVRAFAKEYV
jgi:two-component system, NtrC family, sensor kinase